MRMSLAYGRQYFGVETPDDRVIRIHRQPRGEPLTDPVLSLRHALEQPHDFPPLRRALTPDDHITIVVDERLPHLASLLVGLLDHLRLAGVQPEAVTLLCLPPSSGQPWLEDLPDIYQDVRVEVHQPSERKKLSYLAATREGKRIYLNRSAVDADQLIVLAQRTFDCLTGYGGGGGAIYPALSDEATLKDLAGQLSCEPPTARAWPLQQQAAEVCWLLGTPFFIQAIAGVDDSIQHLLAGPAASVLEGERLLEKTWHAEAERPADLVLATVGGQRHDLGFADLARAFLVASRIVKPGGHIVLLSDLDPVLGRAAQLMRQSDDLVKAFELVLKDHDADLQAAFAWTSASEKARLLLRSGLARETAEELFVQPVGNDDVVRQLLVAAGSVAILPDAHQTMAVVKPS